MKQKSSSKNDPEILDGTKRLNSAIGYSPGRERVKKIGIQLIWAVVGTGIGYVVSLLTQ